MGCNVRKTNKQQHDCVYYDMKFFGKKNEKLIEIQHSGSNNTEKTV
jgi:hypothetical protein